MSTRVLSVDKAEFALSPLLILPPRLELRASGQAATPGWTNAHLEPLFDEDAADTLTSLEFEFVATPPDPGELVPDVLTSLSATHTFKNLPLAATNVVILAKTNQVEIGGIPEPIRTQVTAFPFPNLPDPSLFAAFASPARTDEATGLPPKRQGTGKSVRLSFEEALQNALHDLKAQPGEVQGSDILHTTRVVSITTSAGGFAGLPLTLEVTVEDTTHQLS
ncbi:hypothetical protein [Hymenobacter cellulosivorans]|uniref:Uncharacterized protein n=1 Tax=Hymenobacter cellulosivorans TaxID=2932249 RepID=A0ABY4FE75_9BACT|nr:hypothetical protein [Hymenobacter cellulosivorans]UOQ54327.1 hypothetical protein MUN80_06100 [Hymenobacter cellulosivorans]